MARRYRRKPTTIGTEASIATLARHMQARTAVMPAAEPKPEPRVDKPSSLVAAEADLFRAEMAMRLHGVMCSDVGQCEDRRCRREKRCKEAASLQPILDAARAKVAAAQAKWQASCRRTAAKA